jgi:hypothetical protein
MTEYNWRFCIDKPADKKFYASPTIFVAVGLISWKDLTKNIDSQNSMEMKNHQACHLILVFLVSISSHPSFAKT